MKLLPDFFSTGATYLGATGSATVVGGALLVTGAGSSSFSSTTTFAGVGGASLIGVGAGFFSAGGGRSVISRPELESFERN